jgi:hypothetical protein
MSTFGGKADIAQSSQNVRLRSKAGMSGSRLVAVRTDHQITTTKLDWFTSTAFHCYFLSSVKYSAAISVAFSQRKNSHARKTSAIICPGCLLAHDGRRTRCKRGLQTTRSRWRLYRRQLYYETTRMSWACRGLRCRLLAQSGHHDCTKRCPLLGVNDSCLLPHRIFSLFLMTVHALNRRTPQHVRRFAEIGFRDVESRRVHLQFVMKRPLAKRGSSSSSIFTSLSVSDC